MPGHIVSVSWSGLELPMEARHRVHLVARHAGEILLDAVIPLAELTGREAAVWYEPATPDDELIVRAFDNYLWNVPPYLVDVTPVVIRRGGEVARGVEGVGMGRSFSLETTLLTPAGIVNRIQQCRDRRGAHRHRHRGRRDRLRDRGRRTGKLPRAAVDVG